MEETKEALAITIRELGKQNEVLQRWINALLNRPRGDQVTSACLGFGSVLVNPHSSVIIQVQPQVHFKPERFCVSRECAPHFSISDLRVGMKTQLIAPSPLPARLFAVENVHKMREIDLEDEFDAAIPMTFDAALPGQIVSVTIQRTDDSTVPFKVPFECVMTGAILWDREDLPKGPLTLTKKP